MWTLEVLFILLCLPGHFDHLVGLVVKASASRVADLGPVSWRPTTVKWWQSSQSNRHSTIGTPQTQYHEELPSSANVQSHLTSSFADDGNASWYSVCRVSMVEWRLDCENCRHLTVVGLHDTGPWPRNRVQITCNTSSAYHVQVSCYVPLGTMVQLSY